MVYRKGERLDLLRNIEGVPCNLGTVLLLRNVQEQTIQRLFDKFLATKPDTDSEFVGFLLHKRPDAFALAETNNNVAHSRHKSGTRGARQIRTTRREEKAP
jgi:hypothetical protein